MVYCAWHGSYQTLFMMCNWMSSSYVNQLYTPRVLNDLWNVPLKAYLAVFITEGMSLGVLASCIQDIYSIWLSSLLTYILHKEIEMWGSALYSTFPCMFHYSSLQVVYEQMCSNTSKIPLCNNTHGSVPYDDYLPIKSYLTGDLKI